MDTTHYFAYGSNLNLRQFSHRCPGHRVVGRAVARDYCLAFPRYAHDWKSAVAGIEPADGHHVEGAVYQITPDHIHTLDRYEGIEAGEYQRGHVHVELRDGRTIQAMTYFANPQPGDKSPGQRYLTTILEGARDHALSPHWIAMLEGWLAVAVLV